jgi:dethiobiotin synthetase
MALRSFYITGTDTGIGKTVAGCAVLHALRARGLRAMGMKPVASGCERSDGGWRNADALALQAASAPRPDYADLNPYALPLATAPQIAARDAGIEVALPPILAAHGRLAARADVVVVEGVGGWAAPLADGFDQADLVRALDAPVLLVVGLRLGCLSHARLTARAIGDDGCRLAGWIGNRGIDPGFDRCDDYVDLLRAAIPAPCLGVLPHAADGDARALAPALVLPTGLL